MLLIPTRTKDEEVVRKVFGNFVGPRSRILKCIRVSMQSRMVSGSKRAAKTSEDQTQNSMRWGIKLPLIAELINQMSCD